MHAKTQPIVKICRILASLTTGTLMLTSVGLSLQASEWLCILAKDTTDTSHIHLIKQKNSRAPLLKILKSARIAGSLSIRILCVTAFSLV